MKYKVSIVVGIVNANPIIEVVSKEASFSKWDGFRL
jgi:hypothetical protein